MDENYYSLKSRVNWTWEEGGIKRRRRFDVFLPARKEGERRGAWKGRDGVEFQEWRS